jgi:hypothetical protein
MCDHGSEGSCFRLVCEAGMFGEAPGPMVVRALQRKIPSSVTISRSDSACADRQCGWNAMRNGRRRLSRRGNTNQIACAALMCHQNAASVGRRIRRKPACCRVPRSRIRRKPACCRVPRSKKVRMFDTSELLLTVDSECVLGLCAHV